MPTQTARAYRESLPKVDTNNFWDKTLKIGAILTVAIPISTWWIDKKIFSDYVFSIYISLLSLSLFVYILIKENKKYHRYAQTIFYIHYINHIIRDILEGAKLQATTGFNSSVIGSYFLSQISSCFTIVTGKHCRVCIKELRADTQEIITIARDTISDKIGLTDRDEKTKHLLEENTDFYELWYWSKGSSRYFLCNDLLDRFRKGEYKNSSFADVGAPRISESFLGSKLVKDWKLPYKSTLVVPIRYISDEAITCSEENRGKTQRYWGFLCIDCNSKNVFDPVLCPELGAVFADALYTLFSQLAHMKELQSQPTEAVAHQNQSPTHTKKRGKTLTTTEVIS